jgi:retron-type reverse transcriptase
MTTDVNKRTVLWGLGVIQPASAEDVFNFLEKIFSKVPAPTLKEIGDCLEQEIILGHVITVLDTPSKLFSLTYSGNGYLTLNLRKLRDKIRLFLLRNARRSRFSLSRGAELSGLAGASPALDTSTTMKGSAANKLVGRKPGQQAYWPRLQQGLSKSTRLSAVPRDTLQPLEFLSFQSIQHLHDACGRGKLASEPTFDMIGIGTCLGISPQLLGQIIRKRHKHYRRFYLPKKGGGKRPIDSPRVFLKVIQGFLVDYVLKDLKAHDCVHSYRKGRSILSNATPHQKHKYVGNIDISNFFGSVSEAAVVKTLRQNGFLEAEVNLIAALCTKDDALPQGAPTSPIISNAILYEFDAGMYEVAIQNKITYTRYADDITLSGEDRSAVNSAIKSAQMLLADKAQMKLNRAKTRIASNGGQQRVTGLVVNIEAAPPRILRKKIRAAFHNAAKVKKASEGEVQHLSGYLNYLNGFPKYRDGRTIQLYKKQLASLAVTSAKKAKMKHH